MISQESCFISSSVTNVGDGIVLCGPKNMNEAVGLVWKKNADRYKVRGGILIRRLDEVIHEDIKVWHRVFPWKIFRSHFANMHLMTIILMSNVSIHILFAHGCRFSK